LALGAGILRAKERLLAFGERERCGSAIVSTVMNQILALFVSSAEPSHFARQNENLANLQCGRFYCAPSTHSQW
jgi:hypothetical protein